MFSLPPKSLYSICKRIFSGGTPSTNIDEYWNGDIPWLSSGETSNRYISSTIKKITKKGVDNSSTKLAKEGSIVIASAGQGHTRGQTSLLLCDVYINQSVIALEIDPELANPKYVFYNISSRYDELRTISDSTSSRGSLTTKLIGDLVLNLPERHIQDKIADFLFIIDSKIALNEEINDNLAQSTKESFLNWLNSFADGEYVSAVPNEDMQSLGSLCSKLTDGSHFSPEAEESGTHAMYSVKDMRTNGFDRSDCKMIGDEAFANLKKSGCVPIVDDILIAKDGSYLKELFIVNEDNEDAILSSIAIFRPDTSKIFPEVLLAYLRLPDVLSTVKDNFVSGSAVPRIVLKSFKELRLKVPSLDKQNEILPYLRSVREIIWNNEKEISQLIALRDYLLPKLMSGEIDVSDLPLPN